MLLRTPLTRLVATTRPTRTSSSLAAAAVRLRSREITARHLGPVRGKGSTLGPGSCRCAYSTAAVDKMDYAKVQTPESCYADFCLIPVGTANVSVAEEVAEVQRLLRSSGLTCTMHSAGTTVEGSWDDVFRVIGQAHTLVHQKGVLRVQSSMRVGTRTDKKQAAKDKVKRVEDLLAKSE